MVLTPTQFGLVLTLILNLFLVALLVVKELILASGVEGRWQVIGRFLNIGIVPLLIIFSITVVGTIVNILR